MLPRLGNLSKRQPSLGLSCFMDIKEIELGDDWAEQIRTALHTSRELCVLVSHSSCNSEWVTTEWGAAWVLQKHLTPVLLGISVEMLPQRLRRRQAVLFGKAMTFLAKFVTVRKRMPPKPVATADTQLL